MSTEMQNASNAEKRETPRLEEKNRVTVTVLSSPEAPEIERKSFYCWTHDLSEGGLKFAVHSHVPIGAVLKLEVAFIKGAREVFRHIGRVMWEQEFDDEGVVSSWLGVKFTETLGGKERLSEWASVISDRLQPENGS